MDTTGTKSTWLDDMGATLIHFALAFPVLLMFIMVVIDFGRVSSLEAVIHESLNRALSVATTVPNLDTDTRNLDQGGVEYLRQRLAQRKVIDAGADFLANVGLIHLANDKEQMEIVGPKLFDIVTDTTVLDVADPARYSKIAVLLPGDCVDVPSIGHTECSRETLGTTEADPPPSMSPRGLIRKHPVKVVAFAQFDGLTPWLFKRWRRYEQFAYRQPIPPTPFPANEDPGLLGGVGDPDEPEENRPLGKPKLPEEDEPQCTPNFAKCINETMAVHGISKIPATWAPNDVDGFCYCLAFEDRPQ